MQPVPPTQVPFSEAEIAAARRLATLLWISAFGLFLALAAWGHAPAAW